MNGCTMVPAGCWWGYRNEAVGAERERVLGIGRLYAECIEPGKNNGAWYRRK